MSERHGHDECGWVDEHLEAYVDGELTADETARVDGHLATCPECLHAMTQARRIAGRLRAMSPPACPDEVVEAVRERTRPRRSLAPALAAAAAAAALALGVVWQMQPSEPQRPDAAEIAQARQDLNLALGYIAAAGQAAGRDVGGMLADQGVMAPLRSGLGLRINVPLPHRADNAMVESES